MERKSNDPRSALDSSSSVGFPSPNDGHVTQSPTGFALTKLSVSLSSRRSLAITE